MEEKEKSIYTKRDLMAEMGYENVVVLDPEYLDEAIIGLSHDDRAVYSYKKLVDAFMNNDGWTEDEAIDWIEVNTLRSLPYISNSPIVVMDYGSPLSEDIE